MLCRLGARCTLTKEANLFNEVPSVLLWKFKNECTLIAQPIERCSNNKCAR